MSEENLEEAQPEQNELVTAAAPEQNTKWYVLRVVSGKERKVKEYLDKDIIRQGWDKDILQIFLRWKKCIKC